MRIFCSFSLLHMWQAMGRGRTLLQHKSVGERGELCLLLIFAECFGKPAQSEPLRSQRTRGMIHVLLVEDDSVTRKVIRPILAKIPGLRVSEAVDVTSALELIQNNFFDVLLTDLKLGAQDAFVLLDAVSQISPRTRPVLMSGFATAQDHKLALRLGAVQVLCKPFTPDELTAAVEQAIDCETGFRGSVHGLSILDMLQMFHFARRSVIVELMGKKGGKIFIKDGEFIHAESRDVVGMEALQKLLALRSGSIQTFSYVDAPRTIEGDFQGILLDVLRILDEAATNPSTPSVPPPRPPADSGESDEIAPLSEDIRQKTQQLPAQLDGPLGVALFRSGVGAPEWRDGSLPRDDWDRAAALVLGILARGSPSWSRLEWISGALGLFLLRVPSDGIVALVQPFFSKFDEPRFRRNIMRTERLLGRGAVA